MIGDQQLRLELANGDPAAILAVLNVTTATTPVTCGTCSVMPFEATVAVPMAGGNASAAVPLPCNPALNGVAPIFQWTSLFTSTSPCPLVPDLSFSAQLQATLHH